jgi:hypothetical protein
MMSVILVVFGTGIIAVMVFVFIDVVILIVAITVGGTIVAVLVVVLNLLVAGPSRRRGCTA